MDRGPGVTRELVRATPKAPHKTPPQPTSKTLTPPSPVLEARRQLLAGRGCRPDAQPRATDRTLARLPRRAARRSAAAGEAAAARRRHGRAARNLLEGILRSQVHHQSLPADHALPWRPRSLSNPMHSHGDFPNTTADLGSGGVHGEGASGAEDEEAFGPSEGVVPRQTHPRRKALWRPRWGQDLLGRSAPCSGRLSVGPVLHPPVKGPLRAAIGTGKFRHP